jgi:BioD-like phosphotransacetylase family protein
MKKLIVGSIDKGAGKTTIIVGLAKAMGKPVGYMKPFGDRLLYKKKRLWDYDSALMTDVFRIGEPPEDMSIGFEHAKLRYMYNEKETSRRLMDVMGRVEKGKDAVFVEAGGEMYYGSSVYLDVFSVARCLGGELVIVISGEDNDIVDEAGFIKKYVSLQDIRFKGVIANKVKDAAEFKNVSLPFMGKMGINVLGVVPYAAGLSYFRMGYLADALFAKVLAGEEGLARSAKRIFVGAMSASRAHGIPHFNDPDKLVITSGDRDDMLVAAMETGSAGIILTGNILPDSKFVSKASAQGIPLLLVSADTYQTARQIDDLEPLLTSTDAEKINLAAQLVKEHVKIG